MKVERKKRVRVDEDIVNKALQLKRAGVTPALASRILNISSTTAGNIYRAGGWQEYQAFKKAFLKVQTERRAEKEHREEQAKEAFDEAMETTKTDNSTYTYTGPVLNDDSHHEEIMEELKEINIKLGQLVAIWAAGNDYGNKPF